MPDQKPMPSPTSSNPAVEEYMAEQRRKLLDTMSWWLNKLPPDGLADLLVELYPDEAQRPADADALFKLALKMDLQGLLRFGDRLTRYGEAYLHGGAGHEVYGDGNGI